MRDAVRDLLAQDAEKLEIFLSDDCSTDSSLLILEEEAKNYCGPHKVILNQTQKNLGLNEHINSLLPLASGDIIIPFAGDDRFRSDRARLLAGRLVLDDTLLAHSWADFIGADGKPVPLMHADATLYMTDDIRQIARSEGLFIGATAAWRRELFTKYGPLPNNEAYEDLVLGFRAALEGRISFLNEPLIKYRVGTGVSFQPQKSKGSDFETQRRRKLYRWRSVICARLLDGATFGLSPDHPVMKDLRCELFDVEARLAIYDSIRGFRSSLLRRPGRLVSMMIRERKNNRRKRL